jgi:hypothetical protein
MAAIKLLGFGGMVPALDPHLLGTTSAARAVNTWLYSGALIGIAKEKPLHTCELAGTSRVYRLPASYTNAGQLDDSLWLEFTNRNTDVIRAPVVDDTFDRYYWAATSHAPKYNTRERIEYSKNPISNVVTFSNATELVNWTGHPLQVGDKVRFSNSGGALPTGISAGTDYYVAVTSFGANSFRLSTTLNGAINGTSLVTFTNDGTGTHTLTTQQHQEWLLGVPAPTVAPSINVTGGAAPTVTRSYVYTWVTAYGEEGPPSPPVTHTGNQSGSWDITLTAADANDLGVNRYLTKVRIYRTITSVSGVATYFLVAEQNINNTTYSDTRSDNDVSAESQLQSTNWSGPPSDLEGWAVMPNGIIAGWRKNELWFCEPYRPHAWPAAYTLVVEYPIVGLGVINQTLVVCTTGFPMTAVGVHPSVISTSKLSTFEPCTSRGSILSTPEGVYYSSYNGIVRVVPGRAENITKNLVTKDEWQNTFNVTTLVGARLGTALYYFGTASLGVFNKDAFEETAFEQEDLTSAFRGVLLDPTNERVAFNLLESEDATVAVMNDAWTGDVFIIRDNVVYWIDDIDPTPEITPYLWRSKIFQLDKKTNFGAMKVYFEVPPATPALNPVPNTNLVQELAADQYGLVRIYADGVLRHTRELRTSGELWRLPTGFKADYWQFEVEGRVKVLSIQVAESPKELRRV